MKKEFLTDGGTKVTVKVGGNSIGIGICGILTIIFVIAKLLNLITWPWMWVFAPLWIPLLVIGVIFGGILLVLGVLALVFFGIEKHDSHRRR